MELYWYESNPTNVGDALNVWLWPKVLPALAQTSQAGTLYGIGSILDKRLNTPGPKYVLGSGARQHQHGIAPETDLHCYAVRGPLTARALELAPRYATIDPAALIVRHYQAERGAADAIGFVPYFTSPHGIWRQIAEGLGMRYISPHLDVRTFLDELSHCSFVITEAMHGAILADALRVPWFPICAHNAGHEGETNTFKWTDWCQSVDLAFQPERIPPIWPATGMVASARGYLKRKLIEQRLRAIAGGKRRFLSSSQVFDSKLAQLEDAVGEFNQLLSRTAA
ncbi:hypothetical protein GPA19_02910 [Azoarcus indigens]|uniref:Succinoglycan biosynthesis protein ExoV n=1 Tax=Azoarcus indigens TaxID=29545 RepID=A0A4R6E789_9RHOO|nr:polysaccharide pyruvyl transferase family protein [Azoarcus indigens]NMG63898.1 hypothetical protein [Azoarcus indigens]TDN53827.1 succinoglycan biosynthesis protein ExoV [Azoarcus indigens]